MSVTSSREGGKERDSKKKNPWHMLYTQFLGGGSRTWGFMYMGVFIQNMPRFHSQTNPTRAPATLVYAGSFISSPITGPLFPLCCWMAFKTLIIAAVTSEWRACESGDQLVFFFFSTCLTLKNLLVFYSHAPGDLVFIDQRISLSDRCMWFKLFLILTQKLWNTHLSKVCNYKRHFIDLFIWNAHWTHNF